MKKIVLMTGLFFILGMQSLSASGYDLKKNMYWLNEELLKVQQGFMRSDPKMVSTAILTFKKDAQELLGNRKEIHRLLPKGKKKKVNEAMEAAKIIALSAQVIIDEIENKEKHSALRRRENAQSAYTAIEFACFHCHNLVRDK